MSIRRGDVYQADLGPLPPAGSNTAWEKAGVHPVVVISINQLNSGRNLIVVVPGTGTIRTYATNVIVTPTECPGLRKDTSFECLQIRALSPGKLRHLMGRLPDDAMRRMEVAIQLTLGIG